MAGFSREGYCIRDVPCRIEFPGVGVFETQEWGLRGFKLAMAEPLLSLETPIQVELGLKGENPQKIRLSAVRLPAIEDDVFLYFNFSGLRAPEWFILLSLVVSAQTISFLEQDKHSGN